MQAKHPNQFPLPSFRILQCKIDMPSPILNINRDADEQMAQSLPFPNNVYSLTKLEMMPGQVDGQQGSTSSPCILAVFSKPLHATPEYPDQQGPPSVIVRWHLESAPQAFHPKFDEVPSKKSNAQAKVGIHTIQCTRCRLTFYVVKNGAPSPRGYPLSSICYLCRYGRAWHCSRCHS